MLDFIPLWGHSTVFNTNIGEKLYARLGAGFI